MAGITSSVTGTTTTYVVTDVKGNTSTVTAAATPGGLSFSSSGALLLDGQIMFATLVKMLVTGLRPSSMTNTVASFTN
jgi:hypothetical protein